MSANEEGGAHAQTNDSSGGAEGSKKEKKNNQPAQTDQTAQALRTLALAVQEIRTDRRISKRKHDVDENVAPKKACQQADQQSGPSSGDKNPNAKHQISDSEDSDDDLEDFIGSGETENESQDSLSDLEEFFQPDNGIGEERRKMARITQKALYLLII